MKALTFNFSWPRLAASKTFGTFFEPGYLWSTGPLAYENVPDPQMRGDDWVILKVAYCGVCGSDVKQVFLEGAIDNPIASLLSFPHVLGHETVGTVVEVGRQVSGVRQGDRIAVYPVLACLQRGLPPCRNCAQGNYSLCENFAQGAFAPGMHAGTCRDVSGGFAPYMAVHQSMCFVIPDNASFEEAALADPFAVCLHAILKAPPKSGQTVLVYGVGSLGMLLVHMLSRLYPDVRVVGVDVYEGARELAMQMGATDFLTARGGDLVARIGEMTESRLVRPMAGTPMLLGGVDCVYDTVGSASTLEMGVRLTRAKGTIVLVGVSPPKRFEWTPLYMKELCLVGSAGAAMEDFQGRRRHSFDVFMELLGSKRVSPGALVTHRLKLEQYREGFMTARKKEIHHSLKVLFQPD